MGTVNTLLATLKSQVIADALVPVNTALNSIIETPTTQNAAGQGAQLLASLIPLLPVLEGQAIKDVATALKASLASATAAAGTPAPSTGGAAS